MAQPTPVTPRNNPSHAMLHNEHVNVKMFGAKGDNATDDTQAIRDTIAAAAVSGGSVCFPPGAGYKVSSTIDLSAYTGLHLVAGASTGVGAGGMPPQVAIVAASSVLPVFKWAGSGGSANITFENFVFQYPALSVKFSDGANVRFKNCTFSTTDTADADNTNVLLENWFWAWFEDCSFNAPSTTEPAVILRGKEPSPNVDHCYLIHFRNCRFWYNGVLYKDQNEVAVDAAHIERITFENIDTESFAGTSALIDFQKTAGTNWGGRYIMYPSFQNIAFYDYTGTPPVARTNVPNGIVYFLASSILAPRLFENISGGARHGVVSGFAGNPVVSSGGVAQDAYGVLNVHDSVNVPGVAGYGLKFGHDTLDTNLYRNAAGALRTDGKFIANGEMYSATLIRANSQTYGAAAGKEVVLGWDGSGYNAHILFGQESSWDTNLYRAAANTLQTDDVLRDHKGTPTYSASITPVATDGDWQTITVTNGTAFTINAPTGAPDSTHSQELTIEIFNNSGGAHGAITWNAAFVLVGGALAVIANTKKKFIAFKWNGASWIETSRASADY